MMVFVSTNCQLANCQPANQQVIQRTLRSPGVMLSLLGLLLGMVPDVGMSAIAAPLTHPISQPTSAPSWEPPLDRTSQGMVTSAHPLASQVGLNILQQGGNAVDAAVATTLAISVVEPFSAGIGGGGFLLFYQAQPHTLKALDFRERAPQQATRTLYLDAQGKVRPRASVDGHLAVGVPGTLAGLAELHRAHGKLPWQTLVKPAIQLAEQGFPISWRYLQILEWRKQALLANPEARRIFLQDGQVPPLGDRLVQTDLAKTLTAIAENPQTFYQGTIAQAIAQDMAANGGILTQRDLQQYRPIWRKPLCGHFQQYHVCSMPPPSSGGVHLLQMLNMLQPDLTPAQNQPTQRWRQPDFLHVMIETMRIAYRDRAQYLGDPAFTPVPVAELTSLAYAQHRRREINLQQATPSQQVPLVNPRSFGTESNDTSHLTVVDRDRNAVSLTFTINLGFGAGVVAKGTGIILNNEMDDFAIAPDTPNAFGLVGDEANAIAPGKTPLSSMTPTIVTENQKLRMALGAPGGSTIITTVLQIMLNHLVHGMEIRTAVAAPRLHHQWLPDQLRIEAYSLEPLTLADLQRRGHSIIQRNSWGNANAIVVLPNGTLEGAADPRGEGNAMGY
ncbi:MAG: gamma-glutamyltransferase [Synechococcales bacterium]|nr:gamma-glutamyltransferase [Synechococcales bacterium]